jgi:hypothetical protein
MFFFPRYMKRWKEEGGKGYIFRVVMFFFIVERLGRGRGNLGFQNHIYLPFFFFFFLLKGRGVEVNVFFFPRYMKRWKEEGGKGFIVEWLGTGGQRFFF